MSRFWSVARAVSWRQIHNFTHNPAFLLPSIIFPLFFFTAFAGGLSSVGNAPGFDFPSGYTAFQFVFVLLQSAAFGGVFTGFSVAADFERGFSRRLMLAAPNRLGILGGGAQERPHRGDEARPRRVRAGGAAGATLAAGMQVAKQAKAGSVLLVMLPDTGERYLGTYLFDDVSDGSDDEWLASLG